MARILHIGQKNYVNVYRFVSKDIIEESILKYAKHMNTSKKSILQKNLKNSKFSDNFSYKELFTLYQYLKKN